MTLLSRAVHGPVWEGHPCDPIIAYHVVWGAYGFWLPNDPRGSWSKDVWSPRLMRFGPPRRVNTRSSRAAVSHDLALRRAAKRELMREPIRFTGVQARAIGHGIADVTSRYALPVYVAAVMPDHVHLVFARKAVHAETWVGYFKRAATKAMVAEKLHPFAGDRRPDGSLPTVWRREVGRCFYIVMPRSAGRLNTSRRIRDARV